MPVDPMRRLPRGRRQRRAYEFLLKNPRADYRALINGTDGEYSEAAYNRARNVVRAMKAAGWLTGEPGAWAPLHGPPVARALLATAPQAAVWRAVTETEPARGEWVIVLLRGADEGVLARRWGTTEIVWQMPGRPAFVDGERIEAWMPVPRRAPNVSAPPAVPAETPGRRAAIGLLRTYWLHGHYPLNYRSNMGAVLGALRVLAPDLVARWEAGEGPSEILRSVGAIDDEHAPPAVPREDG